MEKENKNKNKFWKGVLVGALVTAFSGLIIVGVATGISVIGRTVIDNQVRTQMVDGSGENQAGKQKLDLDKVSDKLQLLQGIIDKKFLYDENVEDVESGIYTGMMYGLGDPYAMYYTAEEYQDMEESVSGTYCGIGVMVSQNRETGLVTIIKVFADTPGERAGLLPGDILYKVEDTEVSTMDLDLLVSKHIKGVEGTQVRLTVLRDGRYVEVKAVRSQIEVPTVEAKMLDGHTGYVVISQFDLVTASQFTELVEKLQAGGMERLVIDLRGNPGGVLDGAVDMAAYVLPEDQLDGMIVYTEDKNQKGERYFCKDGMICYESDNPANTNPRYPKKDGHQLDLPIAVLINENSASAAELFTGALKDYGRATVVGTTSFGKGIVQNLIPLSDGSAIKLTTEKYFTPSGFSLHEKGITPDVEVELDEELLTKTVITPEEDNQLQRAIEVLRGAE